MATALPITSRESAPDNDPPSVRLTTLRFWLVAFLVVGLGWRLVRYLLQFPIWGDEAYMCLNFPGLTYLGVLDGLKNCVTVPILFMWGELAVFQWLGGSELAVRLIPIVIGLVALPVFWLLARRLLDPVAARLAVGILAVAYYPVRHACEVRPYSLDLLTSTVLMILALAWLKEPRRLGPLIALCLVVPLVLGLSNPVVFVAGGVSLALLPTVWKQPAPTRILWVAYNLVLVVAFLGYLHINMSMQSEEDRAFLLHHWAQAFPPAEPLRLLWWLLDTHTSNMMAYPIGSKNGGSTLTFLLFLGGVWHFARARRWDVLLLCLVPFALTFIAAVMRRYPYGDSARLCQHLAPATCVLVAAGLASFLTWAFRSWRARRIAFATVCGALLAIGLGLMARDLVQPFKMAGDEQCRNIVHEIIAQAGPECPIVVLSEYKESQPEVLWYLVLNHPRVTWRTETDWQAVAQGERVVCLRFSINGTHAEPPVVPEPAAGDRWHLARREIFSRSLEPAFKNCTENIEVSDFRR